MANKGTPYEREVCRELSAWWTDGKRDDVVWRIPGSGGRATRRGKRGKSTSGQYGDVEATHPNALSLLRLFTIEIKRGYSRHHPFDMIDRKLSGKGSAVQEFEEWVTQAMQASAYGKRPLWLIIHRRDQRRAVAAFPQNLITRLARKDLPSMGRLLAVTPRMTMTVPVRVSQQQTVTTNVVIMPLDDFLRALSPLDVRALTEKPT